ncbi:MAG: hypothetical protein U0527_07585 [Candidatus Eisenbacteria bacterium]
MDLVDLSDEVEGPSITLMLSHLERHLGRHLQAVDRDLTPDAVDLRFRERHRVLLVPDEVGHAGMPVDTRVSSVNSTSTST